MKTLNWKLFIGIVFAVTASAQVIFADEAAEDTQKQPASATASEPADASSAGNQAASPAEAAGSSSTENTTTGNNPALPAADATATGSPEGSASETVAQVANGDQAGLISVDFKDADIRQVLRIIALKSGVDIVAGTDVEGLVTIKLTNVPWEKALDIILRTYGFTYERKDDIVRVMTIAALEQEALSTEVFPLDYAKAKEVPDVIKEMLSERGRVKFDERTNTVIVTDIPTNLFQIKEVIHRLDRRTPQVLIESKVVETKLERGENLGIEWTSELALSQSAVTMSNTLPFKPGASFGGIGSALGLARAAERPGATVSLGTLTIPSYSATLNFLSTRTDTHIVSNPSISALDNQEAKIHVGEEYPIPNYSIDPTTGRTTISGYTAKNIGTVLTVTPHVNPSEEIVVELEPEIIAEATAITYSTGQGNSVSLPRFTVQRAKTQVRIRTSETIAIGGLVKEAASNTQSKVPVLGDIPFIGIFFKNNARYEGSDPNRQDLLVFLTVTVDGRDKKEGQDIAADKTPHKNGYNVAAQ